MDKRLKEINESSLYLKEKLAGKTPQVGIVLGSGLGKLADQIENPIVIPYAEIPNFAVSSVIGHKANFIAGELGGKYVIAMQGRFHFYEGHPIEKVVLPIRIMIKLGIKHLFVSNAAGGVNYEYKIGDLMLIKDHINMIPNPLIGPNIDEFGPRFPDMTRPYDLEMIELAEQIAKENNINLRKGVYFGGTGPTYETPSEYKFFRTIGADVVGMSTTPEVITARHASIPVFGVSIVTNEAHDDYADDYENDGDDVVRQADAAADKMTIIFKSLIERI